MNILAETEMQWPEAVALSAACLSGALVWIFVIRYS